MKKPLLLLGIFSLFSIAPAQTIIDGNISSDSTWTEAGSPYLVTAVVTIETGATLTIEPGVVVKKESTSDLFRVYGTLLARGISGKPILFTSIRDDANGGDSNNDGSGTTPAPSDWGSIRLEGPGGDSSILEYCTFMYGGRLNGVVFADNCEPGITDCEFNNCNYGFEVNGTRSPVLQNTLFTNMVKAPVIVSIGSSPVMSGNVLVNNSLTGIGLTSNDYAQAGQNFTLGQLSLDGSTIVPYISEGWITVPANTALTIEPGVILKKIISSNLFMVEGKLLAEGTVEDPIIFTSLEDDAYGGDSNNDGSTDLPQAGDWGSIRIVAGDSISSLKHCIFRYGGRLNGALYADNSEPVVSDCIFENCSYGVEVAGEVSPVIRDNVFTANQKIPVSITLGSTPAFSGNQFTDNAAFGIGLSRNPYVQPGDSFLLSPIGLQGSENTPFLVEAYITVDLNTTLTIEPGVIIKKIISSDLFQVEGKLVAEGTPENPIVFTALTDDIYGGDSNNDGSTDLPQAGDWGSIQIVGPADSISSLKHCIFRYGGRLNGALYADNAAPVISNCSFENCSYGIEVAGEVSPVIRDNVFTANQKIPVSITLGSTPAFSGNQFTDNAAFGIGLSRNPYVQPGDSFLLSPIGLQGSENTPFLVEAYITVDLNTTLTIEPGVIIKKIISSNLFQVKGSLIAEGAPENPIVFTALTDDSYGGDSNNDGSSTLPARGSWGSIEIEASSGSSTSLRHCKLLNAGRLKGAVFVNGSSPVLDHILYSNCSTGLEVVSQSAVKLSNQTFTLSSTGLLSRMQGDTISIDSSFFSQNTDGIEIDSGFARINHSEFSGNTRYDISNLSPNDIDARQNLWDSETFMNIITGGNPKNLAGLNDKFDNAAYGTIDYSGMLIPSSTIFSISPNAGYIALDTGTFTVRAYPVHQDSKVVLYNTGNGEWSPETVTILDSFNLRMHLDYSKAVPGKYDVLLINGTDTLREKRGFTLAESETEFGSWIKFEVTDNNSYNSGIVLPEAERVYCLVKKATHIGYSGTWNGSLSLTGGDGVIGQSKLSTRDIQLVLASVSGGYYTFELLSRTTDYWNGYIKFCLEPDTLQINEWSTSQILRPIGNDWKVFEISGSPSEMTIQTEGFGKWSNIHIYKDFIGNMENHWFFNNQGKGYNIFGSILNPSTGKYYLKYEDSAVMTEDGSAREDQKRDYLVLISTTGEKASPAREISVSKLSSKSFGQNYATMGITGSGLSDTTDVMLVSGTDTIRPESLIYEDESGTLRAGFDFTTVPAGSFNLVLVNEVSAYPYPQEITVEEEQWNPIGIGITGNVLYRVGRHQSVIVSITNNSNTNIENGYVAVAFDNDAVALNIRDDFYTSEYNRILNQAFEEVPGNKHIFFFSNLAPREKIELHLAMYSRVTDIEGASLEVSSGIIGAQQYDEVMSLLFNNFTQTLKSVPFPVDVQERIDGYTQEEWKAHMDLVMDILGLEHFNYLPDYWGKKSSGSGYKAYNRVYNVATVHAAVNLWGAFAGTASALGSLTGPGGKWQAGGDMAQNGISTILPGGVGLAFGGPLGIAKEGVHHLINIWAKCISALAGNTDTGKPGDEKTTRVLTEFVWVKSTTPEDKYGPIGASVAVNDSISNHFVDTSAIFNYRIDYWNKEDATAPAAIVYIRDTLDTDFDLSSFNFTEIGFLKWSASLEGGQYFSVNIDTRPEMPYIVNIEGTVDPDSREAYWVHTTLDTLTMELTEDPLGGFLPPIDSSGYQIGWVSYTINSEPNLPDSTRFTNQAFVNFDGVGKWGPAPKEGAFTNVFDASRPTSTMKPGISTSSEDSVLVGWTGNDAGSGVQDYTIYVSEGSGYLPWLTFTGDTSAWFKGEPGKTYHFYSIAHDRVGNIEEKDPLSEYQITFTALGTGDLMTDQGFTVYPNPSKGIFQLERCCDTRETILLEINNLQGQRVYSYTIRTNQQVLDLTNEPDGIYILMVRGERGVYTMKLVKQ